MPLQIAAIAGLISAAAGAQSATAAMISAATGIANTALAFEEAHRKREEADSRRGSLVVKYGTDVFDKAKKHKIKAVAVLVTNLDYSISNSAVRLGTAEIGGWGYVVYGLNIGTITNNDPERRGYHNWYVKGSKRDVTQDDNVVSVWGP